MADQDTIKQVLPDLQFHIWPDVEHGEWCWRVTAFQEGWKSRLVVDKGVNKKVSSAMIAALDAGKKWSRNESR